LIQFGLIWELIKIDQLRSIKNIETRIDKVWKT